jgi:geranylgeranyl reductase family protein
MSDYDVIVAGAGPAGSTAARRLAQRGLNVLLLDKAKFPRHKTGAGGIRDIVEKSFLDFDIKEIIQRRVFGQRFFSPSGKVVNCSRPKASGFMVLREEFDHLLLRKAGESGAEVRDGIGVVSARQDERQVTVVLSDKSQVTGRYLVGADGTNSVVAKSLGFYEGWKGKSAAVCIDVEVEVGEEAVTRICGVPYDKEGVTIDIYFGPVPHGYIWCFPKKSILSLGAGCRQDRVKNIRSHFNRWFNEFKAKYNLDPEIISDTATRLPYSGAAKNTVIGRTVLIGDAAGFVNPYSGEGIPMAIQSGLIAAPIVDEAAKESDPRILRNYEKAWKAEFGDDLKVGKSIAKLVFKSEKNMETICRLGIEDPVINEIMYSMIAGLDSYKNLKRKLVKRIGLKHPRAGLSLYI